MMSESGMGAWRSPGTEGVKLVTACKEELAGLEKEIQVLDEL